MDVFVAEANEIPDHYSSLLLATPLLITRDLPIDAWSACCLMTSASYVNHAVNNRITISADHAAIAYISVVSMDIGTYCGLVLSALAGWRKYSYDESLWTNIIYLSNIGYYACMVPTVRGAVPLLGYGYYRLVTRKESLAWHAANGLLVCLLVVHKYGWDWQNS